MKQVQHPDAIGVRVKGKNGEWDSVAIAFEESSQALFYSICPIKAPEAGREQIVEFIMRANYGMKIGNFEMDYEDGDGEIRYKTSIDVGDDRLTYALIAKLVEPNIAMMDNYLPGIMQVIVEDATPLQAIEMVEGTDAWESIDDLMGNLRTC